MKEPMDLKKAVLPGVIGLALGVGGSSAIPRTVEVTPQAAMAVLQAATAQDLVDASLCEQKVRLLRREGSLLKSANRKLAAMVEVEPGVEIEGAAEACARELAKATEELLECHAKLKEQGEEG